MPYPKIAALLLVSLLPACDNPAASTPAEVDFAFDIQRPENEPRFVVSEGRGEVTVRGDMRTPCIGYEARAEADRALRTVEVRIIGSAPGPCFAALSTYGYQATVRGLPAGEYRLRVIHSYPDTGWPTTETVDERVRVR